MQMMAEVRRIQPPPILCHDYIYCIGTGGGSAIKCSLPYLVTGTYPLDP